MKKALAAMTAALLMVALSSSAAFAVKPTTTNLLKHVAYYTVNTGTAFYRWTTPQNSVTLESGGTASQKRAGHGAVSLSITGAGGYADNGFYEPLGTLGSLTSYTFSASTAVSTNLYFDIDNNGEFLTWNSASPNQYTGPGSDAYGFGPSGTSVTVNSASSFDMSGGGSYTLAQLQDATANPFGIDGTTPVAVWIGFSVNSGSYSTTIASAVATFTP